MNDTIKQDINFLEHPLWMQETKKATGQIVKWEDQDGYIFEASGGVPGKVDMLFLYYFMLEAQNHNWADKLTLSRYQILKGCGMNVGKSQRDRLKQSLEIWKRVIVAFSGTFYSGKKYHYMEFGVIDDWAAREKDNKLEIRFNQRWLEKIKQSEFFKYISFTQMKALRSPLALRLYEILVKTFYQRDTWEIDALKLAAKIPMEKKYFADIAPRIQAATKRISDKTELSVKIEVIKQGRGKGKFVFTREPNRKPQQQDLFPDQQQPDILTETPAEVLGLIPQGERVKSMDIVREIFSRDGADGLQFYLEKCNSRKKTDSGSYGGYLKTISDLNLYADYLADKEVLNAQVRTEQEERLQQFQKEQEAVLEQQKRQAEREALDRLKVENLGQYQSLRRRAAESLGIDMEHLKRGERLKLDFAMLAMMNRGHG